MSDITKVVSDMLAVFEKLEATQQKARDLRKQYKLLMEMCSRDMGSNDVQVYETKKYDIIRKTRMRPKSLSKEFLQTNMKNYFKKNESAENSDKLVKFLLDARKAQSTEISTLQIRAKKNKNTKKSISINASSTSSSNATTVN